MATDLAAPHLDRGRLLARLGGAVLGALGYVGGVAILAVEAGRSLVRRRAGAPPLWPGLVAQWEWLFGAGVPLVALVHVGLGSFLAMQAYYGATFLEGTGPVVGVGLCRNVAPLMAGMVLAGLLAGRITWELSCRPLHLLDREPGWAPDRPGTARVSITVPLDSEASESPTQADGARLAATRIVSAMVAGPVLAIWGTVAGTAVGWLVALELLGVPSPIFFEQGFEMLWARDVYGLLVKGSAFGGAAALLACAEGLRRPADPEALPTRAARAACLSALAILVINGSWYLLMYMAGPAFGPTVLPPPVP